MTLSFNITKKQIIIGVAIIVLAVAAVLLFRSGSTPTGGTAPGGGQTYVIEMTEAGFSRDRLEIEVGDTVRFDNKDTKPRWPASDPHPVHDYYGAFDPRKPVEPGQSWEFTFTQEGTWGFHDHLIPHRRGEIIVGKKSESGDAGAGQADIAALLAEQDKIQRAKIVRGMAEKYGPLEALSLMQQAGLPFDGETHLLVHEIGNVAYIKYGQQALKYCTDAFLSACYHGVILNEIGENGFEGVARLVESCKDAGPLVVGQCSHGAGHGFLAWQDYNLTAALPYCDRLVETDSAIPAFNCYDGVFMENLFGVHEGKPSEKRWIKQDDPYYPCNAVPEKYRNGCYADQASVMYEIYRGDLAKIAAGCDAVANPEHEATCFDNFGRQIHPLVQGDVEKAVSMCGNAPGRWRDACLITIMNAEFSVGGKRSPLSYALCAKTASNEQNGCYEGLYANINTYAASSAEKPELCALIADSSRKQACLTRY